MIHWSIRNDSKMADELYIKRVLWRWRISFPSVFTRFVVLQNKLRLRKIPSNVFVVLIPLTRTSSALCLCLISQFVPNITFFDPIHYNHYVDCEDLAAPSPPGFRLAIRLIIIEWL